MLKASENPVRAGETKIWLGLWRWFKTVTSVGIPVEIEERLLVPVQFADGEYGILLVRERMRFNGVTYPVAEIVEPENQECRDAIRHAQGMPEVLAVLSECYRIGVTDGSVDQLVYIRRGKHCLVCEQVVTV